MTTSLIKQVTVNADDYLSQGYLLRIRELLLREVEGTPPPYDPNNLLPTIHANILRTVNAKIKQMSEDEYTPN